MDFNQVATKSIQKFKLVYFLIFTYVNRKLISIFVIIDSLYYIAMCFNLSLYLLSFTNWDIKYWSICGFLSLFIYYDLICVKCYYNFPFVKVCMLLALFIFRMNSCNTLVIMFYMFNLSHN